MRYSLTQLALQSWDRHREWSKAWSTPEPKFRYDAVVIGGGGHGLATAYYPAKEYGITDVAVLKKDWIGGGNTGRHTTTTLECPATATPKASSRKGLRAHRCQYEQPNHAR